MKPTATDPFMIAVSPADLWPDNLREKFRVRYAPEFGERAYMVSNLANDHSNLVTFGVSATGKPLANCTCADFNFKAHACKHVRAAAPLHVWRMRQASRDPRFMTSANMRAQLAADLQAGNVTDFAERRLAIRRREAEERAEAHAIKHRQVERLLSREIPF